MSRPGADVADDEPAAGSGGSDPATGSEPVDGERTEGAQDEVERTGGGRTDIPGTDREFPRMRELRPRTWASVLVRSGQGFLRHNGVDLAGALTYWGVLALFPAAIVVVSLVRLVATGDGATAAILELVDDLTPAGAEIEQRVEEVITQQAGAGLLLSFGVIGALWSASAYLRSFARAANTVYGVPEGRPFYKLMPAQLLFTVVALVLVALLLVGLVLSGPVAQAVGDAVGFQETTIQVWEYAKLPVMVLIAVLLLSLLYWFAPNVRQPRYRWFTPGSLVALVVWIAGSIGFGLYVSNFGAYDTTYGSLGAIIVFLVWLFLSNCAILLGVEINAELQRGRHRQAGYDLDPKVSPLPPRSPAD